MAGCCRYIIFSCSGFSSFQIFSLLVSFIDTAFNIYDAIAHCHVIPISSLHLPGYYATLLAAYHLLMAFD